jgi:hypothetical protein
MRLVALNSEKETKEVQMKNTLIKAIRWVAGAALVLAAPFALAHGPQVSWSVSVGSGYPAPRVYSPPPVVYIEPQPVYVRPQPVYVAPQPVVVQYGQPYYVEEYRHRKFKHHHWRHHRDD